MNEFTAPIKLPKKFRTYSGKLLLLPGHGQPSPTSSGTRCTEFTTVFGVPMDGCPNAPNERVLCAYSPHSKWCVGDEGSPLVYVRTNGKLELAAVVSRSEKPTCASGSAEPWSELNLRVFSYRDWIEDTLIEFDIQNIKTTTIISNYICSM